MRDSTAALHEPTQRIAAVPSDPRQVISAAISGDGEPIEPTFQSALEARFGTDLAGVQVHRSAASDAANAMLGSLAFTVDDHIVLWRGFDERCGPVYLHVLAHETAHVMQKRLARSRVGLSTLADESLLEAEADRIAAEIMRGDPVLKITPDPAPMTIRRWGVAGHYWSYAHRRLDTNTMYAFGVGHLVEAAHIEGGGLRNPHVPDFVNRRPPLYREYGLAMFDLFVELWDQRPEIEREKFGNYLDEVSGIAGDWEQIKRIGLICARETFTVTSDYRPELEPLRSWTKFRSAHPDLPSDLLLRAAKCAEMWAG